MRMQAKRNVISIFKIIIHPFNLVATGAFDSIAPSRSIAIACVEDMLKDTSKNISNNIGQTGDLFASIDDDFDPYDKYSNIQELSLSELLVLEKKSLGYYLSGHPVNAIKYVLSEGNLELSQVDHIVFFEKPFLKFERLLETYVAFAPKGFVSFAKAMPLWIKEKLFQKNLLFNKLKKHDQNYKSNENSSLVINKSKVNENITQNKFQLIDARGEQRFLGLQPEPRKELRSGNIKGSINLPFQKIINENRTFKKKEELILKEQELEKLVLELCLRFTKEFTQL